MIERHNASERMSQAVRHGGLIYLAGQVAADTEGDIAAQTTSVLGKIDALLGEMNATRANVLSANRRPITHARARRYRRRLQSGQNSLPKCCPPFQFKAVDLRF